MAPRPSHVFEQVLDQRFVLPAHIANLLLPALCARADGRGSGATRFEARVNDARIRAARSRRAFAVRRYDALDFGGTRGGMTPNIANERRNDAQYRE